MVARTLFIKHDRNDLYRQEGLTEDMVEYIIRHERADIGDSTDIITYMSTDAAEIAIDDSQVEYRVIESSDATQPRIDISIHEIKIVIPEDETTDPHEFVRENRDWIVKKWCKYSEYRDRAPERTIEPRETFPYRGDQRVLDAQSVTEHTITDEKIILAEEK